MKKILIIFFVLTFSFTTIVAQSIRKDYREFTQLEMNDYVAALNILFTNETITTFANAHNGHFTSPIHTFGGENGEHFFPWHRFFILDIEERLRATNTNYRYLSVPYWDWTTDQNSSSSQFWDNGFLNRSNFSSWGVTRLPNPLSGTLPSPTEITNAMNLTTFFIDATSSNSTSPDFSHRTEHYHNNVHTYVGGTMGGGTSPLDPIFYLHHGNIDKLWQQWEDKNTAFQSSFPNGTTGMIHYSPPEYPITVTANSMRDSRSLIRPSFSGKGRNMDVWYAENGKVLLDGANGSPFIATDAAVAYTYRYTAATSPGSSTFGGSMYVGDVEKDASGTVIDDDKGGFEINNTVKCNFLSGSEIIFRIGFWAKSGSQMDAKIITSPNEPGPLLRPIQSPMVLQEESKEVFDIKVFPNPIQQKGSIQYSVKETTNIEITFADVLGRTIKVIESQMKYPGNYTTEINATYLPPHGIYFVKILIGKHTKVFKIVK